MKLKIDQSHHRDIYEFDSSLPYFSVSCMTFLEPFENVSCIYTPKVLIDDSLVSC